MTRPRPLKRSRRVNKCSPLFLDGKFGAYMQVHIQNDGPVTISLESPPPKPAQEKQVIDLT